MHDAVQLVLRDKHPAALLAARLKDGPDPLESRLIRNSCQGFQVGNRHTILLSVYQGRYVVHLSVRLGEATTEKVTFSILVCGQPEVHLRQIPLIVSFFQSSPGAGAPF